MTKRYLAITFLAALLALFGLSACQDPKATPVAAADQKVPLEFATYRTPIGWGYDILVDRKVFIHQDFIPAVQGKMGFDTEEKAEITARAVMAKMKKGQKPYITLKELKSLGCLPQTNFQ